MTPRRILGYASIHREDPPELHVVRKYRNKPTECDGVTFDSKKEARRYMQLRLLEKNGEVRKLRLQVSYPIAVDGKLVCRYRADFVYEELRKGLWTEIVEDVKGVKTAIYRLKKKLMRAIHGVEIRET